MSGIICNQTVWIWDQAAVIAILILIHTSLRNLSDLHLKGDSNIEFFIWEG